MSRHVLRLALVGAALIHLLPLPGLLGGPGLQSLYGLPLLDPAGELLLRHRALMFALDAAQLLWAVRAPALRLPAIVLTLASDIGFLRVARFDGLSILLLVAAAARLRQAAKAHP